MSSRPRRNTDAALQDPLPFDPQQPARTTNTINQDTRSHRSLNQYAIGHRIGKGKHGVVYLCRDEARVGDHLAMKAVKRTNPSDRFKLLRKTYQENQNQLNSTMNSIRKEIAIMKKCRHANLVRLVEVVDDPSDEKIYIIMENLSGGRVQWSNGSEPQTPILSIQQTQRIMRDVILGLEYLHNEGIIHRDIKPDNIIYTRDHRTVKLIDFGIAHYSPPLRLESGHQLHSDSSIDSSLFPPADLLKRVGTPSFLAPEVVWFPDDGPRTSSSSYGTAQAHHPGNTADNQASYTPIPSQRPPVTKAIDIWSLGATLYCFLFGDLPFQISRSTHQNTYNSEYALYNLICTQDWRPDDYMGANRIPTGGRHPQNSGLESSIIIYLLDRMLQKNPARRITLSEIKTNPWILKDLENPEEWLHLTNSSSDEGNRPASSNWIKNASMKLFKRIPNPR